MLFADRSRTVARGWLRVVIVCGTSHSSGGQWAPRDEDVRQEVLLRGGGGGVMGYLQSLVGNCPGIPHWDCPAIWLPIPREEDEGDCCSLPSLPAITSRPTQGGRGSYM